MLPGRSPILVAKQLASLARLAPKRVLPVFGLSPARPAERVAFPVPKGSAAPCSTSRCEVVRRLLREPSVTFHGDFFDFEDASVGEPPQPPLDIWLGGSAPAGLRRIGRYARRLAGQLHHPRRGRGRGRRDQGRRRGSGP